MKGQTNQLIRCNASSDTEIVYAFCSASPYRRVDHGKSIVMCVVAHGRLLFLRLNLPILKEGR